MLKNNYLILLGFQEGEKDQLRDEAITRDITALVTSAFGGQSSDSKSNGNTRPEIEVQQVTVYVDDGPNENKFSSGESITNGQTGLPSKFPRIDSVIHEGSISIKTATVRPPSSILAPTQPIDSPKFPPNIIINGNNNGVTATKTGGSTLSSSHHLMVGENINKL